MKDIRIFVASSKELERERNELAYLVLAKEEEFAARGLRVRLAKWEYVDPRMTGGRTEDRYLDEMYDCDAAFVRCRIIARLYWRRRWWWSGRRQRDSRRAVFFADNGPADSDSFPRLFPSWNARNLFKGIWDCPLRYECSPRNLVSTIERR